MCCLLRLEPINWPFSNVHHDVKEIQIVKGSVKPLAEGYTFKPYFE